jgi:hypothetical protein
MVPILSQLNPVHIHKQYLFTVAAAAAAAVV